MNYFAIQFLLTGCDTSCLGVYWKHDKIVTIYIGIIQTVNVKHHVLTV